MTGYAGTDPGRTSHMPHSGEPVSDTLPYGDASEPPLGSMPPKPAVDTLPGVARESAPPAGSGPVARTIAMSGELEQALAGAGASTSAHARLTPVPATQPAAQAPAAQAPAAQPSAAGSPSHKPVPGPIAGSPVTKSQAMTFVAGEGLGLSRTFNTMLSKPWPGWRAELIEPAEPSTGGGRHARQHISIIGPSGLRLSIGRVDTLTKTVQLRGYEMVNEMWLQRFNQPFPINGEQYRGFIGIAAHLLTGVGLAVTHEVGTISVMPPPEVAPSRDNSTLWLVMVLCVAVLLALLIYSQT